MGASKETEFQTQLLETVESKDVVSLRKCQLRVLTDQDKSKTIDLNRKNTRIGKKEDNDLVLNDNTVSRNHIEIIMNSDFFLLKDLNSTNGAFINDIKVKEAYLTPGDIIKIGNTELEFIAFDEKVSLEPSPNTEFGELVGKSRKMRQIFSLLEKISPSLATIIIEGETGTGKELVAKAIHASSHRKSKPFVVFDCSAVTPTLIESELFGHEKGAFTGAIKQRKGAFEAAYGGTVFLDEIGELSLELQPKLLRALEQREIKRVGSNEKIPLDVRVICATNRDLKQEVEDGNFREDLYYRLSVVKVHLPPLRERPEDIALIIKKFLEHSKFNQLPDGSAKVKVVEDESLKILQRYQWPGNVRELANIIERTVSMAEGDKITASHLSYVFQEIDPLLDSKNQETPNLEVDTSMPFKEAKQKIVENFEKDYLEELLKKYNYNVSKASREAKIDRKHLRNLIKKYNIQVED